MAEGTWNELKNNSIFESVIDKMKLEEDERMKDTKLKSRLLTNYDTSFKSDILIKKSENGQLIETENKEEGKVSWRVQFDLIKKMGISVTIFSMACLSAGQSLIYVVQWWLSSWANTTTTNNNSNDQFENK